MAKQCTECRPAPVPVDSVGTGAPGFPTSDMIVAGVAELNRHTSDEFRVLADDQIVALVWKAMEGRRAAAKR